MSGAATPWRAVGVTIAPEPLEREVDLVKHAFLLCAVRPW